MYADGILFIDGVEGETGMAPGAADARFVADDAACGPHVRVFDGLSDARDAATVDAIAFGDWF